jgi:hypothetical protein
VYTLPRKGADDDDDRTGDAVRTPLRVRWDIGDNTMMIPIQGLARDEFWLDRVCAARVCDYLRGGAEHFSFDRRYATALPDARWRVRQILALERSFLSRAVVLMLDRGIRQFLDLGSGIPSLGGPCDMASLRGVRARVVHVDSDPAVIGHAKLLGPLDNGRCRMLSADAMDAQTVLSSCVRASWLDPEEPIGVLAVGLMHLVPDHARPHETVQEFGAALPSGSAIALTHLAPSFAQAPSDQAAALIAGPRGLVYPRRRRHLVAMFAGLTLMRPGIVALPHSWCERTTTPARQPRGDNEISVLAGFAVKQ